MMRTSNDLLDRDVLLLRLPVRTARARTLGRQANPKPRGLTVLLAACSLLPLLVSSAPAQGKRKPVFKALIYGTVFDPQSRLVRGAAVTVVLSSNHRKTWRATTSDAGEFYIYVPPNPADYEVEVRAPGFASARSVVHVRGSEKETVFLHLQPSS